VTVSKEGYLTLTIARQESRDLTVFLNRTSGSGSGAGVDPGFSAGSGPSIISGRVSGFKLPRPLEAGEEAVAQVWVAPTTVFSTPPIGYTASADSRDAMGERWQVYEDGGSYSVFSYKGLRAVYAVFGIRVKRTGAFTPVLMGVRRGISADPDRPARQDGARGAEEGAGEALLRGVRGPRPERDPAPRVRSRRGLGGRHAR
jgi:hypothetical protein